MLVWLANNYFLKDLEFLDSQLFSVYYESLKGPD